jgi:hypothetical protein
VSLRTKYIYLKGRRCWLLESHTQPLGGGYPLLCRRAVGDHADRRKCASGCVAAGRRRRSSASSSRTKSNAFSEARTSRAKSSKRGCRVKSQFWAPSDWANSANTWQRTLPSDLRPSISAPERGSGGASGGPYIRGDGVRRARPGVCPVQGGLRARHRLRTRIAAVVLRQYDEGIRPIIPCVRCWASGGWG